MANGWGGRRVGSGRKAKSKPATVIPFNGPQGAAAIDADDYGTLVKPPDDLVDEVARQFWETYAPHALAERTLAMTTVAGFRQLAEMWAYDRRLTDRIQVLGPASREAEGPMRTWLRLSQRIDASLARFKLTAFGKPAGHERPRASTNPFAALGKAGPTLDGNGR